MKKIIILRWDAIVISIGSVIYGFQLMYYPELLDNYKNYEVLSNIFNSITFGTLFIFVGLLKLLAIYLNSPRLRAVSISLLIVLWTMFAVGFFLSNSVNTGTITCGTIAFIAFGVALREWFH